MKSMKYVFCYVILILLFFTPYNGVGETTRESMVKFDILRNSVVQIRLALYFDSKLVHYPSNIQKIEKKYGIQILDSNFPISYGSGFFISSNGYLITNAHVINLEDTESFRGKLFSDFVQSLYLSLPQNLRNVLNLSEIRQDFKNLFLHAPLSQSVKFINGKNYSFTVLARDKELDLALLKVQDDDSYLPLELGNSDSTSSGENVIAIGYPLSDFFEYFLKDFSATITQGYVSSLRKNIGLIQHTASLNPGSSGGPLFNENGRVIGINSSGIPEANEMFFSISVNTLKNWLDKAGYRDILIENKVQALEIIKSDSLLSEVIEAGKIIFIYLEEPAEVYIDDNYFGMAPGFVKDLTIGEHILKLKNDFKEFTHKINIDHTKKMVFNLYPIMENYQGSIFVHSNPEGAAMYIDEQLVGNTPFQVSQLTVGDHEFRLVHDNYFEYKDIIAITKIEQQEITINLEPACLLTFAPALSEKTSIIISRGTEKYTFMAGETIRLPYGSWNITLSNPAFLPIEKTVELKTEQYTLELKPDFYTGKIFFTNLRRGSYVYVDGVDVTARIKENFLVTEAGDYLIIIKTKKFEDFRIRVEVKNDETINVKVEYAATVVAQTQKNNIIGWTLLGGGIICLGSMIAVSEVTGNKEHIGVYLFGYPGIFGVIIGGTLLIAN